MSSESELRDAMHSSTNIATAGIDTEAVVRKARARRVPKQLAFSSLSVLAVVGVAALGITTLPTLMPSQTGASDAGMMATTPDSSQDDAAGGFESKLFQLPNVTVNPCGLPTESTAPVSDGLALSLDFPTSAPANGASIDGTVTMKNFGVTGVSGTTTLEPVITLSRDGITVWQGSTVLDPEAMAIDLGPGESHIYSARFVPVQCVPEGEEGSQFPDNLAALPAGSYDVRAEILVIPNANPVDSALNSSVLVGSPISAIELR